MLQYLDKSFDKFTDQLFTYRCFYLQRCYVFNDQWFIYRCYFIYKIIISEDNFLVCFSFLVVGITLCISSILYIVIIYF